MDTADLVLKIKKKNVLEAFLGKTIQEGFETILGSESFENALRMVAFLLVNVSQSKTELKI